MTQPLADLLRPQSLADFVGQQHLVGSGKPLYRAIEQNIVPGMILWGPPGVGKTTLARLIAAGTGRAFHALSAVSAGKNDLREIVEAVPGGGQRSLFTDAAAPARPGSAILFLDEIHRFNKAQQDYLLPFVENGTLVLIGATTENPSFEVIPALLSRLQVFVLKALTVDDLQTIVRRGAQRLAVAIDADAALFLAEYASGDARAALNLLDNAVRLYRPETVTLAHLHESLQSKHLRYDKTGEEHYDTISAFIKSMRAGQVDAALYYLARMIDAGEDARFIARRMVIFASEDIGMALPTALVVANEVFRAVETVGLPEAQINLAHGVVYLASAPKDRSSYDAYFAALADVQKHGNLAIPLHIRNAPTRLLKDLGYGTQRDGVAGYLPEALQDRHYYPKKPG
ncbi:MAG: replication-associated recombination protein A [Anaerolineae bacterium]|nr:replication-associated recombination protein A [Anaerolineae bacterium]